ncbi:phosphosugar isomerase [Streptomyces sp. SID4926]|nr:phosphosugar isomerase [Streptomyces sp. SID4926]
MTTTPETSDLPAAPPGAAHTSREIGQQPRLWRRMAERVEAGGTELRAFLSPLLADPSLRIVLTGAGTSAFAGGIAAPALAAATGRTVEAVATTDIVATPHACFPDRPVPDEPGAEVAPYGLPRPRGVPLGDGPVEPQRVPYRRPLRRGGVRARDRAHRVPGKRRSGGEDEARDQDEHDGGPGGPAGQEDREAHRSAACEKPGNCSKRSSAMPLTPAACALR